MPSSLAFVLSGTLAFSTSSHVASTKDPTTSSEMSKDEWQDKQRKLWIGWGVLAGVMTVGTILAIAYRAPENGSGLVLSYAGTGMAIVGGAGVIGYSVGLGLHSKRKPHLTLAPLQLRVQF